MHHVMCANDSTISALCLRDGLVVEVVSDVIDRSRSTVRFGPHVCQMLMSKAEKRDTKETPPGKPNMHIHKSALLKLKAENPSDCMHTEEHRRAASQWHIGHIVFLVVPIVLELDSEFLCCVLQSFREVGFVCCVTGRTRSLGVLCVP
jgi:hypothetical protein